MLSSEATYWLSIVVFLIAAATSVAVAWREARRTGFRPKQYPLYLFGLPLTRILWRARVVGRLELPAAGGAVIVSNHRGPVDPAFVSLACLNRVRWMVAREYFGVPVFGSMLRNLEAIPTRRGGVDTAAIKQTIRAVRQGDFVGVFPEGRINDTDCVLLPLRSGAALIALQARVPLIPCFIQGSPYDAKNIYSFFFRPAKTTITIGRPIELTDYSNRGDDREVHDELTLRIGRAIAELAGESDYEPELAGKRRRADSQENEAKSA